MVKSLVIVVIVVVVQRYANQTIYITITLLENLHLYGYVIVIKNRKISERKLEKSKKIIRLLLLEIFQD